MTRSVRDPELTEFQRQQGVHPIFWACADGDVEAVRAYLDDGIDVNITHPWHCDLLATAISTGDLTMVSLLIDRGVEVNRGGGEFDLRPLHLVPGRPNSVEMARRLVEVGAMVDVKDSYNLTPVMKAAGTGDLPLLELLVSLGVDLNEMSSSGHSAFYGAAIEGQIACADRLLQLGAGDVNAVDKRRKTPLHWVAQRGNAEAVRWLLAHGANPELRDDCKKTPLDWARDNGHVAVVKWLSAGGDGDDQVSPAAMVPQESEPDLADLSPEDAAILQYALDGDVESLRKHFDKSQHWALRDHQGYTVLMLAVDSGSTEAVEFLLDAGADVNEELSDHTTALCIAVSAEYADVVDLLISRGAAVNVTWDVDQLSPLMNAVQNGNLPIIESLIRAGASLDQKDIHGLGLLSYAMDDEIKEYLKGLGVW